MGSWQLPKECESLEKNLTGAGAREGMATHLCSGCDTAESKSSFGLNQLQMAICVLIRTEQISTHGDREVYWDPWGKGTWVSCDYWREEPLEEEGWLDSGGLAFAGNQKTLKVLTLFEGISPNLKSAS